MALAENLTITERRTNYGFGAGEERIVWIGTILVGPMADKIQVMQFRKQKEMRTQLRDARGSSHVKMTKSPRKSTSSNSSRAMPVNGFVRLSKGIFRENYGTNPE